MEKWKGAVIALIIIAVGGYGWFSSHLPAPQQTQEVEKPPAGELDLQKLVGNPAPDFNIPASSWANTGGNAVSVESLKGHVTVLEFWRATCPHCRDAAPFMEQLYQQQKDNGVKFVGIQSPSNNPDPKFVENDWEQVKDVIKEWGTTYPVGFDSHSRLFKEKYNGSLYPTVMVLDKDGIVRYSEAGYDEAKAQKLQEVVKQLVETGTLAADEAAPAPENAENESAESAPTE